MRSASFGHALELALGLPRSERAALAREVLMSLDCPSGAEGVQPWEQEILRRLDQLESGTAQTIEADEVLGGAHGPPQLPSALEPWRESFQDCPAQRHERGALDCSRVHARRLVHAEAGATTEFRGSSPRKCDCWTASMLDSDAASSGASMQLC